MKTFGLVWGTLSLLVLAAGVFSCTGPVKITGLPMLLSADFETDAEGAQPNPDLPGDPAGDRLVNGLAVENAKIARYDRGLGLRIANAGRDGGRSVAFVANAKPYPATVYYLWDLRLMQNPENGDFKIDVADGSGTTNLQLMIRDIAGDPTASPTAYGKLVLMPSREELGRIPVGQNCSFSLELDHTKGVWYLTVTRPGFAEGSLKINRKPIPTASGSGSRNPTLSFAGQADPPEFSTGGSLVNPPSGSIIVDKIRIQ